MVVNVEQTDPGPELLKLTHGLGADLVFECAGVAASVSKCIELVRHGGRYFQIGTSAEIMDINFALIAYKELTVTGSIGHTALSWETTTGLTREDFEKFTRYCQADNPIDNNNRAKMLGFDAEMVQIAPGAILRQAQRITIGKNTFIGLYTYLNGDVTIGENVLIGPHCSLSANNHIFFPNKKCFGGGREAPIVVQDGAWLAAGCQVTAGTTVGRGTLVCANATVTQDTPEFAIMAGIPARQVGHIDVETGEQIWYNKMSE